MSELSLETAYIFYASYHHDVTNKWIHILCIWPIFVSGIVLLYLLSPLVSFLVSVMYASYYAIVEQPGIAGPVASFLVCLSYFFAFWLYFQHVDPNIILRGAALIHVVGWLGQFYGHAFHEGRAPALLTNLYQALMMAPLFVLLEVFFMFGYKKGMITTLAQHTQNPLRICTQSSLSCTLLPFLSSSNYFEPYPYLMPPPSLTTEFQDRTEPIIVAKIKAFKKEQKKKSS